jgi:hypothetical protein
MHGRSANNKQTTSKQCGNLTQLPDIARKGKVTLSMSKHGRRQDLQHRAVAPEAGHR